MKATAAMATTNGAPKSGSSLSIFNKQKETILSMLHSCTTAADPFEDSEDVWKVLIYDNVGRDILAPLLSVSELRAAGVTLHMLLHNVRHPIPDVPAVYFVEGTKQNVERIAMDASKGTYASLWVNFTGSIKRETLEHFGEKIASLSSSNRMNSVVLNGRIGRVYDMYNSFHSLQHNLFSLNLPGCYAKLNATGVSNAQVEQLVDDIVDKLFCALVTLGVVPIIKAQKGGPANLVATMLENRLREHLKANNNTFSDSLLTNSTTTINSTQPTTGFQAASVERPLLLIIDRALDLPVMLHHTWTYQALAHDLLGLRLNRVTISSKSASDEDPSSPKTTATKPGETKTFDLDQSDEFWTGHAGLPFPMVAEAVEGALQAYKDEIVELNRSTGALGNDEGIVDEHGDLMNKANDKLAAAVSNIPGLAKKKRQIDLHTNIATAILDRIKLGGLDGYFQVEEELLSRPGSFDVQRILALLGPNGRGSPNDKLRLFLIYYLCIDSASQSDLSRCLEAVQVAGCTNDDLRAYTYLKSIRAFTKSMSTASTDQLSASSSLGGVYAASVLDTLSQVANNVNKLILSTDNGLATARDVAVLMDGKPEPEVTDRYILLDPKSPRSSASAATSTKSFKDAIVFVVGPGNYIEFQNCQDYVCSRTVQDGSAINNSFGAGGTDQSKKLVPNGKTIIYGATELCTGEQFLAQLAANGTPIEQPRNTAANGS